MLSPELLKKIKHIEISSKKLVNEILSGEYHSVFKGIGVNFSEVREYQFGDDIRFIDWNVTARSGKPFIKIYEEERELNVVIIIDASASTFFSSSAMLKNEIAAEISALLAFSALENNDKTGVIMFTDKVEKFIPPQKSKKNSLRIIREILSFKPKGKKTNLKAALEFAVKTFKKKSVVFIISDFYADDYLKPLTHLSKKHDVTAISISDNFETKLTSSGLLNFTDSEEMETVEIDASNNSFAKNYINSVSERFLSLKQSFLKLNIDFIEINTAESYINPLIQYFRKRIKYLNK